MPRKKTNQKKSASPWTFRPTATTLALWPLIASAYPRLNASRIINDAIQLHGAAAARLFLLQEQAKLSAALTLLAAGATEQAKPEPAAVALETPQRLAEAMTAPGQSGDAMKAIETP